MTLTINDLVGKPYKAADCFKLAQLASACFGIKLEDEPAPDDWQIVPEPAAGDLVVFESGGAITHIGVVVAKDRFIHSVDYAGAVIERLSLPRHKNRIENFYRKVQR